MVAIAAARGMVARCALIRSNVAGLIEYRIAIKFAELVPGKAVAWWFDRRVTCGAL